MLQTLLKDFLELIDNSVYGMTTEKLRKKIIDRLIMVNIIKEYVTKPSFVSQKIFSKHFVAIFDIKPVLTLNKPTYIGFSILGSRKCLMCDFYYNCIKRKNGPKLLFTDTGSLFYKTETNDVYEDFYKYKDSFGLSDYPQDPKFFDLVGKKAIGKMKDEFKGKKLVILLV